MAFTAELVRFSPLSLAAAFVLISACNDLPDDDSAAADDDSIGDDDTSDDDTAGDDDTADDDSVGDDDTADDDDSVADDDTADDDDSVGDDDTVGDDDSTGDDDTSSDDDSVGDDDTVGGDDDSAAPADEWSGSVPEGAATMFVVNQSRGPLTLTADPLSTSVDVFATFSGGTPAEYASITMILAEVAGTITLSVTIPPTLPAVQADVVAVFPADLSWTVNSSDGDVDLNDLRSGGQAFGADALSVHFAEWAAPTVVLTTTSGPVNCQLPSSASTTVTANTAAGAVSFTNFTLNGVNFNGSAVGTIGSGAASGSLTISASAGDIGIVGY